MGGKSSKTQITRYYMSQWWGIAMKLDAVLGIDYGEKEAWRGRVTTSQTIEINKTNLYGGDKKEGGLAGRVTFLMGDDAQVLPDALATRVGQTSGADSPGARGLTSLFFTDGDGHRGFYWVANSPYLKQLAVTGERIPRQLDSLTAEIPREVGSGGWPPSGSGGVDPPPGYVLFDPQVQRIVGGMPSVFLPKSVATSMGYEYVPSTDSAYYFARSNESGLGYQKGGTEPNHVAVLWLVEKGWVLNKTAALVFNSGDMAAIVITATPTPPASVSGEGWGHLYEGVGIATSLGIVHLWGSELAIADPPAAAGGVLDANPAHIIFECLTDTSWGLGEDVANIDVASFQVAAQTLYNERFGLSLVWDAMSAIEDFVNLILSHINAALFTDPATGLLKLKLVRDDYDRDSAREVNPDNAKLTKFSRKAWGDTINEIQVSWTDPADEEASKVVLQDDGNIAQQGSISSSNSDYPGVRRLDLAWKLAERDLRAASAPLSTGEASANRTFYDAEPMEVVKLHWPEYGVETVYARVTSVTYGALGGSAISLALAEDVFSYALAEYTGAQASTWEPVVPGGAEATGTYIMPAPYYGLAAALGVATAVVESPTTYATPLATADVGAAATYDLYSEVTLPNGSTEYQLVEGGRPFMAKTTLGAALVGEAVSTISGIPCRANDVLIIGAPSLGADNQEIALVAAVDAESGVATVWRAIGDTTPKSWPEGTEVWFGPGENLTADSTERVEGATAKYKFFPLAADGDVDDMPVVSAMMVARASLPYPPADVKIGGVDAFTVSSAAGAFTVTWAHRNKETQAEQILKQNDASVTPPGDVRYGMAILNAANAVLVTRSDIGGNTAIVDLAYTGNITVKLWAISDDGASFQSQVRTLAYTAGSATTNTITAGNYSGERAFERPYVDVVASMSPAEFSARSPDAGFVAGAVAGAERNFDLYVDAGAGYKLRGSGVTCPTATLAAKITGSQQTGISISAPVRLSEVAIGSICLIEDELCRVDAINVGAGTVSLGRGCADTVPTSHPVGTSIFFYGNEYSAADSVEYPNGKVLGVKLPNKSLGDAEAHSVTISRRLARPYPPAQLQLNGVPIFEVSTIDPGTAGGGGGSGGGSIPATGPTLTPEGTPASIALGPNGGYADDAPYQFPLPPHSPSTSLIVDGDFDAPGALDSWTDAGGGPLGAEWNLEPDGSGTSMRVHYLGIGMDAYYYPCTFRLPSQPLPRYFFEFRAKVMAEPGMRTTLAFCVGESISSGKVLQYEGPFDAPGGLLINKYLDGAGWYRKAIEITSAGRHIWRYVTPFVLFQKSSGLSVDSNGWFDNCALYVTKIDPPSSAQALAHQAFDAGLTGWTLQPAAGAGSPTLSATAGVLAMAPTGEQRTWQNVICDDPIDLADAVGKYVGITAEFWSDDPAAASGVTQNGVALGIIAKDTVAGTYAAAPILGCSYQRGDFTEREVWIRVPEITGVTWHLCASLRAATGKAAKLRAINVRVTDAVVD